MGKVFANKQFLKLKVHIYPHGKLLTLYLELGLESSNNHTFIVTWNEKFAVSVLKDFSSICTQNVRFVLLDVR